LRKSFYDEMKQYWSEAQIMELHRLPLRHADVYAFYRRCFLGSVSAKISAGVADIGPRFRPRQTCEGRSGSQADTFQRHQPMSAFPSKADIGLDGPHVRLVPLSDIGCRQAMSASPSKADIARHRRHVSFVPARDIDEHGHAARPHISK
jgi:hypothetical protein